MVGTLGRDVEVKTLPSTTIATFSIANNTGFGDKKVTTWYRVSIFGKRAENGLINYLKKGQQVFVSGEFSVNEYQAKDGTNKTSFEINANVVDLVGKAQEASAPAPKAQVPDFDIPF